MPPAPLSDFPEGEYRTRVHSLAERLRDAELDGLVVLSEYNYRYLTGHWTRRRDYVVNAAVLRSDGNVALICPDLEEAGNVAITSWVKDVRPYVWLTPWTLTGFKAEIVRALQDLGIDKGKIGIELGHGHRSQVSVGEVKELQECVPQATWVDAGWMLWAERMIKSEAERETLRHAIGITEAAREDVYSTVKPGVTERELHHVVGARLLELGAERCGYILVRHLDGVAGYLDRSFRSGDVLHIDMGAVWKGYFADVTRVAAVGRAPRDVERAYRDLWELQEGLLVALKPGMRVGSIMETYKSLLKRARPRNGGAKDEILAGWCGHGIGLEIVEPPILSKDEEKCILEPGMTLMIEPSFVCEGKWYVTEEAIAITETGSALLTPRADAELRVV